MNQVSGGFQEGLELQGMFKIVLGVGLQSCFRKGHFQGTVPLKSQKGIHFSTMDGWVAQGPLQETCRLLCSLMGTHAGWGKEHREHFASTLPNQHSLLIFYYKTCTPRV